MAHRKRIFIILVLLGIAACSTKTVETNFTRAQKAGYPIYIHEVILTRNGIFPLIINWANTGDRVIYEVAYHLSFYDEEGEVVSEKTVYSGAGRPFYPSTHSKGKSNNRGIWPGTWYRNAMDCVMVEKVTITYTDESQLVINSAEEIKRYTEQDNYQNCKKEEAPTEPSSKETEV